MPIISVRLSEAEKHMFTEYSKFHGTSLSALLKESLIEKIEEELDEKLFSEAKEYNQKHPRTYTHEEVKQELGL